LLRPVAGKISFDGEDVTGCSPPRMLALGVAHCPEGRRVFPYMSVRENLRMGCYLRSDSAGIERDMKRLFDVFRSCTNAAIRPRGRSPAVSGRRWPSAARR
jgi:branched-chain amino acid transport system ATP-binding protein